MKPGDLREALSAHEGLREHADDIVLALTLAGRVVDVWTDPAAARRLQPGAVRGAWPELGEAIDALTNGPGQ